MNRRLFLKACTFLGVSGLFSTVSAKPRKNTIAWESKFLPGDAVRLPDCRDGEFKHIYSDAKTGKIDFIQVATFIKDKKSVSRKNMPYEYDNLSENEHGYYSIIYDTAVYNSDGEYLGHDKYFQNDLRKL